MKKKIKEENFITTYYVILLTENIKKEIGLSNIQNGTSVNFIKHSPPTHIHKQKPTGYDSSSPLLRIFNILSSDE